MPAWRETIGVNVNVLTPEQVKEIWPLCETDGILGAIQHPDDGYIQPADLTQALARGARDRGAEIYRNTTVTGIEQTAGRRVAGQDRQGRHRLRARRLGDRQFRAPDRRDGRARHPGHPGRAPVHRHRAASGDPGAPAAGPARRWACCARAIPPGTCARRAGGLLLGPYEKGAPACYVDGPSDDSEYELFQEDLERLMPHIETAIARVPAFGEVGIKKVYNGAIAYTPDGSPIIGPAWDLKNFWLNEGHSFGVTAAGGAGWQLAEWIVEGEPTDRHDGRRSAPLRPLCHARLSQGEERGSLRQRLHAALSRRGARRRAAAEDDALLRPHEGARRGVRLGLRLGAAELVRAGGLRGARRRSSTSAPTCSLNHNHAPADSTTGKVRERWSFRRSNYFEHVGNECRNVTENVGLQDMSAFAKC